MKDYSGVRKEMKEAGWRRRDRKGEELWQHPASEYLYGFEGAVRRFKKDREQNAESSGGGESQVEKVPGTE